MTAASLATRLIQHSAIRFCLVGLVNTAVGLSLIYAGKFIFGLGDILANAIGYAIGLMVSFTLNSRWTFRYDGPVWPALLRFLVTFAISYAANIATVLAVIGAGGNSYLAHAIAVVPYTTTFYLLSRFMVFVGGKAR